MKIPYEEMAKKTAKDLAKSNTVIIERNGNTVYICNGYYVIKVPEVVYRMYFRAVSPLFVDTPNPEGLYEMYSNRDKLPQEIPYSQKLTNIWNADTQGYEPINVTPYIVDKDSQYPTQRRVCYEDDGALILLNEQYYQIANCITYHNIIGGSSIYSPVFFREGSMEIEMMILPIKSEIQTIADMFPNAEFNRTDQRGVA